MKENGPTRRPPSLIDAMLRNAEAHDRGEKPPISPSKPAKRVYGWMVVDLRRGGTSK